MIEGDSAITTYFSKIKKTDEAKLEMRIKKSKESVLIFTE